MRFFSYGSHNLTHLQGGGYVLSRRAAVALATCKLGHWAYCPPAQRGGVFRDIHDRKADASIQSRCESPQVNAEDLLTGVCMHEAGFSPAHNTCMKALGAATLHAPNASASGDLSTSSLVTAAPPPGFRQSHARLLHKLRHDPRCPCPITAHPLKGALLLGLARKAVEAVGCDKGEWHSSVSRAAEQKLKERKASRSAALVVGGRSGKAKSSGARMADTLMGMEKVLPCSAVMNNSYPIAPELRALLKLDCPKGSRPLTRSQQDADKDTSQPTRAVFGRLLRLFRTATGSSGVKEPNEHRSLPASNDDESQEHYQGRMLRRQGHRRETVRGRASEQANDTTWTLVKHTNCYDGSTCGLC